MDRSAAGVREAVSRGYQQIVQRMLEKGFFGQNVRDWSFELAVELGERKMIQTFLDAGADFRLFGKSALLQASIHGSDEIVTSLLAEGATFNAQNHPLCAASENGHDKIVSILLSHGANARAQTNEPLRIASKNGHDKVVSLLLAAGAQPRARNDEALLFASQGGFHKIVRMLLDAGANVHARKDQALYHAAENGHTEVVLQLLEAGWGEGVVEEERKAMVSDGHCSVVRECLDA